jgi:hypothetical protein
MRPTNRWMKHPNNFALTLTNAAVETVAWISPVEVPDRIIVSTDDATGFFVRFTMDNSAPAATTLIDAAPPITVQPGFLRYITRNAQILELRPQQVAGVLGALKMRQDSGLDKVIYVEFGISGAAGV